MSEKNQELNTKLTEMGSSKRKNSTKDEINDSISELNKKNNEMEVQLKNLQKELEDKSVKGRDKEIQSLIEQFNSERKSLIKSYEKKLSEEGIEDLKKENEKLKYTIKYMQEEFTNMQIKSSLEESNESLKNELMMLKDTVSKSIADIHNKDKQELDTLMKENLNLKKEINELKVKLIKDDNDVPNFKLELLQVVQENTNIKSEIFELKSQMEGLKETLSKERQLLMDFKIKNENLEQNIKKLSDAKTNQRTDGGEARISKKREVGKEDELAWNNLYGIKKVGKGKDLLIQDLYPETTEPGEYSKIQKLELEFEKTKEEIAKKNLQMSNNLEEENKARELKQNCELLELKRQIIALQNRMMDEKSVRSALENKIAEISIDLKDKEKLEMELNSLRRRLERDFVPKSEIELIKYQKELQCKKQKILDVNDGGKMDADLKEKCERLAREREKAKELEKKSIGKKFSPSKGKVKVGAGSSGGNFNPGNVSTSQFVPAGELEPDIKFKLEEELDKSIKKHLSGK